MKSSRLLKVYEEYIKTIDMNSAYAKSKYFHSLKSMDLANQIANSLNMFNEDEIVIIELIALFHDIGNFSESNYNVVDNEEEDLTMKSINILFDGGLVRKITDDTQYDNMIKLAIFCHNKEGLPKNISDKMVNVCNIIKDVHNIEEIRMAYNYPFVDNRISNYPSSDVYNDFKLYRKIDKSVTSNNADNILVILSSVFGFNFNYSYTILVEKDYVAKLIDSLIFSDKKIEKFFDQIKLALNSYIKKKIINNN